MIKKSFLHSFCLVHHASRSQKSNIVSFLGFVEDCELAERLQGKPVICYDGLKKSSGGFWVTSRRNLRVCLCYGLDGFFREHGWITENGRGSAQLAKST